MAPKLYVTALSAPARAVLLTAAALRLNLDLIYVDMRGGEHKTPYFLKLNPQHTVPTLDDDGFHIWDSHAIAAYLATKYGAGDDSLYPRDPARRAIVDQRLHFDSGVLFPSFRRLAGALNADKIRDVNEGYAFLETFLKKSEWLAGDKLTIADFCAVATVSSLDVFIKLDPEKHSNILRWWDKCQQIPYFHEHNQPGIDILKRIAKSKL